MTAVIRSSPAPSDEAGMHGKDKVNDSLQLPVQARNSVTGLSTEALFAGACAAGF